MVLRLFLLVITFFFVFCSVPERDNPLDPDGVNYFGRGSIENPSSSSNSSTASNCSLNGGSVSIGEQVWMSENLNCDVSGSKCYDDDPANCDIYGRLYNWATAMALPASCNSTSCESQIGTKHRGICPSGWHIPSYADWNTLMEFVNPSCTSFIYCDDAGTYLKATWGWSTIYGKSGNGTDDHNFSALPGGYGSSNGGFSNIGEYGYWWSSTEHNANTASNRYIYGLGNEVFYGDDAKNLLYSVRCIKD